MARVTIKDVAREAGVSLGSVSRVLNGLPVSDRLLQKVNAAIAKLGYAPDALAQSMRTHSTGAIGCLVPDISNPLYAAIVNTLDRGLQHQGYMLMLASPAAGGRSELQIIAEFQRRRVDGLIIAPDSETDPALMEALGRFNGPIVVLGRDFQQRFDTVLVEYRTGVQAATRYLLSLGHRRIALMTPLIDVWPGRERVAGFRAAYAELGLDPALGVVLPQTLELDAAADVDRLLGSAEPPTALLAIGGRVLTGALRAIRSRGLRIPTDLSLISIGDPEWVGVFNPAITALRWDVARLAQSTIALLLKSQQAGQAASPQRVLISTDLVLRDSCAPPAAVGRAVSAY